MFSVPQWDHMCKTLWIVAWIEFGPDFHSMGTHTFQAEYAEQTEIFSKLNIGRILKTLQIFSSLFTKICGEYRKSTEVHDASQEDVDWFYRVNIPKTY